MMTHNKLTLHARPVSAGDGRGLRVQPAGRHHSAAAGPQSGRAAELRCRNVPCNGVRTTVECPALRQTGDTDVGVDGRV